MDNTHLSLRFESVALFVFSLAIGILLLKLRDLLFGRGIDGRNHHISFKKKIEEETQRVCEKTGMTPEQLADFSNNPKNFSEDQWSAIEGAKRLSLN